MVTCRRSPLYGSVASSKPDKLFTPGGVIAQGSKAIAPGNEAPNRPGSASPSSPNLELAPAPKPTPDLKPVPTITYLEADLQRLLRIDMSAKNALQESQKCFFKAWFPDLYYKKSHIDFYFFC